jgi:hypothetical protein
VQLDSILEDCWRRREKLNLIFFRLASKGSFKKQFFKTLLEMLLSSFPSRKGKEKRQADM